MPRKNQQAIDGFLPMEDDTSKIRKRGCSPTSSSSSIIQHYRFKRAVLIGKRGVSGGGSSTTPLPSWRIMASRSPSISLRAAAAAAAETPRSQSGGKSTRPVSARKLAATLWEMNEVSTPRTVVDGREGGKKDGRDFHRKREKVGKGANSLVSGLLPSHLSDPSHSPVSERSDRSGLGHNRRHRQSSSGRRLSSAANDAGVLDSASNASFMEVETRSRCHTSSGSTTGGGVRNRLKDVSNALTTSKELLKIINRIRSHESHHHHHQSSSSTSLISALNTELERASLQVNHIIQEQHSDSRSDINALIKQFDRERAAWKHKEREAVEAAIESVAGELEVERKLRRRVESLNKRLGKELAETKEVLLRTLKEVESQKRARGEMERVCDELEWELGGGGDVVEMEGNRRGGRIRRGREEADNKEREMLQVVDLLREERAREKKYQSEAGHQLKNELKEFMRTERSIEKAANYSPRFGRTTASFIKNEKEITAGGSEVESGTDDGEGSGESDLHSIELSKDGYGRKDYKLGGAYASSPMRPPKSCSRRLMMINEVEDVQGRKSVHNSSGGGGKDHHRVSGSSLLRSRSDMIGFSGGSHSSPHRPPADFDTLQQHRRSCGDHDLQRYKSVKGLREQILSSYRSKDTASPARKWA